MGILHNPVIWFLIVVLLFVGVLYMMREMNSGPKEIKAVKIIGFVICGILAIYAIVFLVQGLDTRAALTWPVYAMGLPFILSKPPRNRLHFD